MYISSMLSEWTWWKMSASCAEVLFHHKTSDLLCPALLPPHLRPRATSQTLPSPNTNSETPTYDLPKNELDTNSQPWDPGYSSHIPQGSGIQVKPPSDTSSASAQTSGKYFLDMWLKAWRNVWTKLMFCLQTPVPPLPPRPSFMQSMPEYLILLPSSPSSSSSSQKSRSEPKPALSPTSKGSLFCCQNKNSLWKFYHQLPFFSSPTQDQVIRGSCQGILMWSLSV